MNFLVNQSKKLFLALLLVCVSGVAQEKVSDIELNHFAEAVKSIQEINANAQRDMLEVVDESGFELEKFNSIYQAAMEQDTETLDELTEEEAEKFESILARFEAMQMVFQKQMEKAVIKEQITLERFDEIAEMMENDFELQTRLQVLMEQ